MTEKNKRKAMDMLLALETTLLTASKVIGNGPVRGNALKTLLSDTAETIGNARSFL